MPVSAILHTPSRVIRRLTVETPPPLNADETAVLVPDGFDLQGGPWKLAADNQTLVAPTTGELEAAFTPPLPPRLQNLVTACQALEADGALPARVRTLAARLRELVTPPPQTGP